MKSILILGLLWFLLLTPASSAALLDDYWSRELGLTDYWKRTDYPGQSYSHFPHREKRLSLTPSRHLLDVAFSRQRARVYRVQDGDTLAKIARRHWTTLEVIYAMNRLQSDRLKIGQKIWVPDRFYSLEIDKTFNRLYLSLNGEVIKVYPVSTGKTDTQSPPGTYVIQSRYPFPTWFHKGEVVSPGSPDNYLGTRWLGFDKPQFGIHGTIFPELIGQSVSKGCVRMVNEDVEEIYEFVPIGTTVVIRE